ncbi:MAG: 50S ribosome-binding GTPase [Planctomycetes bacterium]|nr:50S ribosome-binding GTPase [Planctomycetota bacterium]MCB9911252.1 50S ribosome-binding GTPase [Planctomycetota bacterium]HPF14665.1 50S ribosome-binding GTPase [Planctomycetota bacterium]
MKPSATIPLLHAEMERLRSDRSLLAGNQGMGGDESALDRWIVDLDRQRSRVGRAAVLTLVGSTGAGKSTLLNALVGQSIAIEGESRPTTSQPIIYAPADADVSEWLADLPGPTPRIERYEPDGSGAWSGQIVIDAPDTNSVREDHRTVVRALAERSDVLVVVAHRQAVVEHSTVAFLEEFAHMRGMVFVLGHADALSQQGRVELAHQFRDLARERFGIEADHVHVFSPREAQTNPETPGWQAFCADLFAQAEAGQLVRVRRYNALGTVGRLADWIGQRRAALRERQESVVERVAETRTLYRQQVLSELDRRLSLRKRDVEAMLWEEVGRRWPGPGGMALRAGGMASLGLGAGAWLARRNPLLAAGATVGALASSKLQSHGRDRAMRAGDSWLPSGRELESLYERAFAPLRMSLQAAGLSTASLPSPGELEISLQAIVDEGLSHFLDTELLEEAEGGAHSGLRWLVDVPIYGFALWILYRSALGFYQGQYVGMDFLVNALVLAAAWLWAGRSLVRLRLRARATRLVASVRTRLSDRFAQTMEQALAPAEQAAEDQRQALDRMAGLEPTWRRILEAPGAPASNGARTR